ncbi:MAG: hypothetical protein ACR2PA_19310 [Hyphomicrobiaceae bacterium]
MLGRLIGMLVMICLAVILVTVAVINRHEVRLVLDPFNPQSPDFFLPLPLYAFLFAMLIVGVMLGGAASWFSQGKWRKTARQRTQDAMRWKAEAERLTRERDERVTNQKQLLAS